MLESRASVSACSVSSCVSPSSGLHDGVGYSDAGAFGTPLAVHGAVTGGGVAKPLLPLAMGSVASVGTTVIALEPAT